MADRGHGRSRPGAWLSSPDPRPGKISSVARELAADPDPFARQKSYAIRINDEFTVDVLPSAAGVPWDALREYIRDIVIDGIRVRVLNLEGLLKTKSGTRPKDQFDAAAITRALDELRNG